MKLFVDSASVQTMRSLSILGLVWIPEGFSLIALSECWNNQGRIRGLFAQNRPT
ncbi:hypothetical protein BDW66DRAFT_134213 [Aspergillus desertorum]